jgi:hypothetical protein
MDHVVYLDAKAKELDMLINGNKTMIIRGATGRKIPYGRVSEDDILYFIENDGSGTVMANARVTLVHNSPKQTREESTALVEKNQPKLQLTPTQFKRWAGKRYIVLIGVSNVKLLPPFSIDKTDYSNMDDWLPVSDINNVKLIE